jgi:CMP-N-acetylneuraminic acid synthetase
MVVENKNISIIVPIRKGSQRVARKNIRDFSNIRGGLTFIKISQLIQVKNIDKIIISTDDDKAKKVALSFNDERIIIDDRPEYLASSETTTTELIDYMFSLVEDGIVIWTHTTSPFVTKKIYENAIKLYLKNLDKYDSLVTVTELKKFIWDKMGPINYDADKEKWPQTQTIDPVYEINSGIFILDMKEYNNFKDRIGKKPFFYMLNWKQSFDIDWEEDFEIAELLWSKYGDK